MQSSFTTKRTVILAVLWLACAGMASFFLYKATHAKSSPLPLLNPVPVFTLTAEDHRAVTLSDFKGRISIADFIFTSCQGPCPMMTTAMAGIQAMIPAGRNIHLYSFTVDPENDSPEVLSDYARHYGADAQRWSFLTGNRDTIENIIRHGFRLAIENPDSGDITHSTKFVLIDKNGTIRGYYDSDETSAVERLTADALELEGE